ncbi:MAG: hypothetical protein QM778_18605 [Myxococcales bacterium]
MRALLGMTALSIFSLACKSEVPRPPKPGETCWPLGDPSIGSGEEFCDVQACFPKERAFSANVPANETGFVCDTPDGSCPKTEASSEFLMTYQGDGFEVVLFVSPQLLLDGYSTAGFQNHVLQGWVQFQAAPSFQDTHASTQRQPPTDQLSVLSYANGLLHVQVKARGFQAGKLISTPPYTCFSNGWGLATCTTKWCSYESEDGTGDGASMVVTADITAPVAPIAP